MTTKKTRKGPSVSATKFPLGTTKRGNDGHMWVITSSANGIKRWTKTKSTPKSRITPKNNKTQRKPVRQLSSGTSYFTHMNHDRPYLVTVQNKTVHIYRRPDNYDIYKNTIDKTDYSILVHTFNNVSNIYIGKSIKGDHYTGKSNSSKGNSILLHLQNKTYAFIGNKIFTFSLESDDSFEQFFSSIGPNNIPYPILLGKKNIYFMMKYKSFNYISREYFIDFPKKYSYALHSYEILYGQGDHPNAKKHIKKINQLKLIHENN